MSYESEIRCALGDHVYDAILAAVDSGEIGQILARDIAKQLHPKVGGSFIHASAERNFVFNRRAFRKILSDWYQFVVPQNPVKDLVIACRHEDVELEALANQIERLAKENVSRQTNANQGLWQSPNQYGSSNSDVKQRKR